MGTVNPGQGHVEWQPRRNTLADLRSHTIKDELSKVLPLAYAVGSAVGSVFISPAETL